MRRRKVMLKCFVQGLFESNNKHLLKSYTN